MKKIGIVVDAGADIPDNLATKYQIGVVPVKLEWPELESLPGENVYQKMRIAEEKGMETFGKTSQPSPKDFLDVYKKRLESFQQLLCFTITSRLSGTYNSAIQGKNFLPPAQKEKVFVIDTLNVSGGEALFAFKALHLIESGMEAEEIAERLRNSTNDVYLRVILKDPKWVEKAGRISPTVAGWMRKLQKIGIHPLLGIKKGELKPVSLKIEKEDKLNILFKELAEKTSESRKQNKKIWAIITHGDDQISTQKLKQRIEEELEGAEIIYTNLVNNIVGSLAGPDALALAWMED